MHEWVVTIETEKFSTVDQMASFERFTEVLDALVDFPSGAIHDGAFSATMVVSAETTELALSTAGRAFVKSLAKALDSDDELPMPARVHIELAEDHEPAYA
jgi:hypothetical protein